jgi:hypothetical protein
VSLCELLTRWIGFWLNCELARSFGDWKSGKGGWFTSATGFGEELRGVWIVGFTCDLDQELW